MSAPPLIVCARDLDDADRQLRRLPAGKAAAHVVLVGWAASRKAAAFVRLGHRAAEIYTPEPLAQLERIAVTDRPSRLAAWIGETLITQTLRRGGSQMVHVLWRDDWAALVAAGSALVAVDERLAWWTPDHGRWAPIVPRGRLLARSLQPPPAGDALDGLIGSSPAMQALRDRIRRRAHVPFPVLFVGETGTGKGLCARAMHSMSHRRGRFVEVAGELLHPDRAESELFGHTAGAVDFMSGPRTGLIREAEHGTLFLDEIDALPTVVRSSLVQALSRADDGVLMVRPLGADRAPDPVPTRLVTASRVDPRTSGTLPPDLYFRVAGLRITIPPLRDRGADVLEIAGAYLEELARRVGDGPQGFSSDARSRLLGHAWPGNVRELRLVLRDAFLTAREGDRHQIRGSDLVFDQPPRTAASPRRSPPSVPERAPVRVEVARLVTAACALALSNHGGDRKAAARELGLGSAREFDRYWSSHQRRLDESR